MVKATVGKKIAFFFLMILAMDLMTAENAEARRRCFGRRSRGVSSRSSRGFNSRSFAHNNRFNDFNRFNRFNQFDNRVNINDPFGLARVPADILSSLTLDPTGSLQRLAIAPNIGVNRNGQFFELNGFNSLDIRQPLAFSNGQFFGGQLGSVSPDTLRQMQLINDSGNFQTLPFR